MLNRCTGLNLYPGFESLPHRHSTHSRFAFGAPRVRSWRASLRRSPSAISGPAAEFLFAKLRHCFVSENVPPDSPQLVCGGAGYVPVIVIEVTFTCAELVTTHPGINSDDVKVVPLSVPDKVPV